MKRTLLILLTLCISLSFSACGASQAEYEALQLENESLQIENESLKQKTESNNSDIDTLNQQNNTPDEPSTASPEIDETSWNYIIDNYEIVTYDDVKSGKYCNQYAILPVIIDSSEYSEALNWVTCYAWFAHDNSFICDDIIFQCDEMPNYSPESLQSGDNVDVCFYIDADNSFGFQIKGFSKNDNATSLEDIYSSFKENCTPLNWEEIMRNPDGVRGTTYTFTGNVFQIISEKNGYIELLLSTNNEDEYVHLSYRYKENDMKFLENDTLTIYGTFYVPYKYTSVLGTSHSIPAIVGQFVEIQD